MTASEAAAAIAATLALLLHGCAKPPAPSPRYTVGAPYQTGPVWHYPREDFDLNETGLASIAKDSAPRLTTNGEAFDQTALAAAHPTLQLPAIARLTNLENGRAVTLRINDRGSGDPHRLIEVTKRTASLLAFPPQGPARVRLQVLANESHAAADALPGAPGLALAAAPRGSIRSDELPPLPGARTAPARPAAAPAAQPSAPAQAAPPLMRLPEQLTQTQPAPGRLILRLDTFEEVQYASVQQAKMAAFGAQIVYLKQGRTHRYRVDVGPFADVARADAALDRALASGIPDARIVVD